MAKRAISLEEQRIALEQQLADIAKKEKAVEADKQRIIGEVVWQVMLKDAKFATMIHDKLAANLSKNTERALFDLPKKPRKTADKKIGK